MDTNSLSVLLLLLLLFVCLFSVRERRLLNDDSVKLKPHNFVTSWFRIVNVYKPYLFIHIYCFSSMAMNCM